MTWRGSTDFKDRLFGSLVYIVPLITAIPFGGFFFAQFPSICFNLLATTDPFSQHLLFSSFC